MNQLITNEIKMTSLDIAEVVGKEHKNILADIRKEIKDLGDEIGRLIFQPSTYINLQNKEQPCYQFGKEGAMQLALKYDAKTRFKVIKRIEELEGRPKLLTDKEQLKASMRLSLETSEEVEEIKKDVSMLKDTMRIDGNQEYKLQKTGRSKVVKSLGGKNSLAYKKLSRSLFQMFWNEFKDHFEIPRYTELPKKDFNEALTFISAWQPRTSARMKIESLNQQMTMDIDAS